MKSMALVALAATLLSAGISASEETSPQSTSTGPHFKLAIITSDKYSQDERNVFAPDAPKVFAVYRVVAGPGTKVKAVWLAEKVAGLEPKTKITENPETKFSARGEGGKERGERTGGGGRGEEGGGRGGGGGGRAGRAAHAAGETTSDFVVQI